MEEVHPTVAQWPKVVLITCLPLLVITCSAPSLTSTFQHSAILAHKEHTISAQQILEAKNPMGFFVLGTFPFHAAMDQNLSLGSEEMVPNCQLCAQMTSRNTRRTYMQTLHNLHVEHFPRWQICVASTALTEFHAGIHFMLSR